MGLDLYYLIESPPCRSVMMVANAIGVVLNLKILDLDNEEHLKPEFLKINPQHVIPTLVDGDFALWESRAICTYLINKYGGENQTLYPVDPQARALVDQRLYFDIGTLYQRFSDYWYPRLFYGATSLDPAQLKKMEEALGFLNTFLEGSEWVAGKNITVADFSVAATVATIEVSGFDFAPYPNVQRWFAKAKTTLPGYELNEQGAQEFKKYFDAYKKSEL